MSLCLINIHMQNGMRPTRSFIHLLGSHLSELHSCIDDINCLRDCLNGHFHKPLHKYLSVILLSYLKILALIRVEQILYLVKVDLIETEMHMPLKDVSILPLLLEIVKHIAYRLRDYSMAVSLDVVQHTHSMSLSSTCLTINKVSTIESI